MKLEIEELVVHGVSGSEAERLRAVIERELTALARSGRGAVGGSLEVPGGVLDVPAGLGVDDIGRRVAESIWTTCRSGGGPRPETGPPPMTGPPAWQPGSGDERKGG